MVIVIDRSYHDTGRIVDNEHLSVIHRAGYVVDFNAVTVRIELIYSRSIIFSLLLLFCCHSINECRVSDLIESLCLVRIKDSVDLLVRKDHSGKNTAC